jgi:hypothetical protein
MAPAKPKDHYVAAGLIGRFSARPETKQRTSPIWVLRRGRTDAFQQTAERVAYRTALYTLEELWIGDNVRMVDQIWQRLEGQLPAALSALEGTDGLVDARLWAEAMVPFIASLFVRSPDFGDRFGLRFAVLGGDGPALEQSDSITQARLFQLQRLFSPVMRASWRLLRCPKGAHLITSNLALAPLSLPQRPGWVVPLSRTWALHLKPRPRTPRVWLTAPSGETFVDVEVESVTAERAEVINRALATHAPEEIYGDPEEVVLTCAAEMSQPKPKPTRVHWDDLLVLRRNQHELLDFLAAIASPYDGPPVAQAQALDQVNYPIPIFISINPKSHMAEKRSRALSRIEDAEAQKEHARLSRWLDVKPLRKVTTREES